MKQLIIFLPCRSFQAALRHYVLDNPGGGCLILFLIDSECYQNVWLVFEEPVEFLVDVLGDWSNYSSRSWNYVMIFVIFIYGHVRVFWRIVVVFIYVIL